MPLRPAVKPIARALIVAVVFATVGATLGCGQRGPLFVPDKENPDKRR